MPTPLYDALREYAKKDPARFHMPGHKGKFLPAPELMGLASIDVTELPPTGNLYTAGEPFDSAQRLWAERFGFDFCQFLTGGSTMGIHTGLALCCKPGEKVLMDRSCHRAAFNALALLDLEPVFLPRPWMGPEGVAGPMEPETVEKTLAERPEIKTVSITSPTYYGVLSDIPAIAAVCRAHGAKLLVDGAHGAHLPFLGYAGYQAADAVVMSAHKTLPAPGQSALLFANGFPLSQLQRWGSVYGSSSPSYVLMAALDGARDYMEGEGAARYRETARLVGGLRERRPALGERDGLRLDPARLTLTSPDGFALARALGERGVYPEMADAGHVVCILTCADGAAEFDRLERALEEAGPAGPCAPVPAPPEPSRAVLSPRQALFAPRERAALRESEGRVAACQIAPYPPGVPVIAPGERIEKKHLAYLREIGYNKEYCDVILKGE